MNANFTPKKDKEHSQQFPTIKISPVKVPNGAKQIGNYILGKTIGSGTYGKVHLGLHIPTGERVAVKITDKMKLHAKDLERIHREIQILKKIIHPSLIQLYEIIETERSLLLVTEYMQNGELFNYIIERKKLSEDQACQIFQQIIDGLDYMHHIGIAHRDLKPQNILIDYDHRVKIIDFGLSNLYKKNQKLKTQCGSPCYAAPEMIQGKNRYEPILVDIWSAGIVLFAMLSGYLPFCDPDTGKLYKKILSGSFKCPTWISDQAKDLIQKILVVNPTKRIRIQQIMNHPWYKTKPSQKLFGIDTRHFKIPYQPLIMNNIQKMGVKIPNLQQFLQSNSKNKQTALYYIIAKKMVKEGYKITTFYGSQDFRYDLLSAIHGDLMESGQNNQSSTQIDVEAVSPIPIDSVQVNTPETSSAVQFYHVKSTQFKSILDEFLNTNPRKVVKETEAMKGQFYANNLDNRNKKQNLKLEQRVETKQQKTCYLLKAYRKTRCHANSTKKNVILPEIEAKRSKIIQTLDTASTYANPRRKFSSQKCGSVIKKNPESKFFF